MSADNGGSRQGDYKTREESAASARRSWARTCRQLCTTGAEFGLTMHRASTNAVGSACRAAVPFLSVASIRARRRVGMLTGTCAPA